VRGQANLNHNYCPVRTSDVAYDDTRKQKAMRFWGASDKGGGGVRRFLGPVLKKEGKAKLWDSKGGAL